MTVQLRDYQRKPISEIYYLWGAGGNKNPIKRVMLFSATGSGKTVMAGKIISDAVSRGKRVWFLVHRDILAKQTRRTLKKKFGIDSGIIIANQKMNLKAPVQITSVQTINNRDLSLYGDCDLLIADECHSTSYHKSFTKLLDHFSQDANGIWDLSNLKVLGLTASPWRTRKTEGFCQFYQGIVRAPSISKLVELKQLRVPRLFSYDAVDTTKLELGSDGEYTDSSIKIVCNNELNDIIISRWIQPVILIGINTIKILLQGN